MRNLLLLRFMRVFAPLGWPLVRLVAGLMLAAHGFYKITAADWPGGFAAGLEKMGAPAPEVAAVLSTFGELVGGLLLAVGLFTRPAGLVVAINMAVAILLAHTGDIPKIGKEGGAAAEYPLLLLAVGIAAVFQGGGPLSLDRVTTEKAQPPPAVIPPPPGVRR